MVSSNENPGHGNVGEIRGFHTNQSQRTSESASVSSRLITVAQSQQAVSWSSASATAWQERIARVLPTLDAAAQVAEKWASAADTYARTLESLTAQAARANRKIDNARHMLYSYSHVPAEVSGTPSFQAKINELEEDINEGHGSLWSLQTQRNYADSVFAGALAQHSALGEHRNWTALQSLYGDAKSVTDIRDTRNDLVDKYSELGEKLANGNASGEEIDELAKFFANSGADPALADKFWDNFTGEEATTMLVNGVYYKTAEDDAYPDDPFTAAENAVDFAQGLRSSLSAASLLWDTEDAEQFASEMWTDSNGYMTMNSGAIGYLFDDADNWPMSERFTVAMADVIDAYERGTDEFGHLNGPAMAGDPDKAGYIPDSAALMARLWLAEDTTDISRVGTPVDDPLSRVLDTLGLYPEAAWDWLSATDSTLADGSAPGPGAENRVDYYAQRDWSVDGWDGFGALWEGSMHADGGLISENFNSSTWTDMCDAASRIVAGLDDGGHLSAESLSEPGAAHLGNAVAQLIPAADYQLFTELGAPREGDPQVIHPEDAFVASAHPGTIAYLDGDAFGDLITTLASSDSGLVPIRQAVTQVQVALIDYADGRATFEAWDLSLQRVAALEASLAGSVGGASILDARLADESVRAMMQLGELPLAFIPGSGAGAVVDLFISEAAGFGWQALTDHLAGNVQMADDALAQTEDVGAQRVLNLVAVLEQEGVSSLSTVSSTEMSENEWNGRFAAEHEKSFYSAVWRGTDGQ